MACSIKNCFGLMLAGLLFSTGVQAQTTPLAELVAQQLRDIPIVRASFVQTKQIAALKRPVISRGRFIFSKEHGILWELQQPINLTYLLQTSGTIEIAADGRVRRQSGREAQGMNEVGRILSALWGGNTRVLEPLFQTQMQGLIEQWTLTLVPKSAPLSEFLTRIAVTGSTTRIQRVLLVETGGDLLTIDFQPEVQPAPLSAQELRVFQTKP